MKKRIYLEVSFICILGIIGWYLFGVMKKVELDNPERKAIESYNSMVFISGAGIDVKGNYIDSVLTNQTDDKERYVIAFLLRYNSLDTDIHFWNEVNNHLSSLDNVIVRLIAYCEHFRCVEAIRVNPSAVNIPVLEYGEVSDMQAVIGADVKGEFWLRGNRNKKIKWRDHNLTPFDIAMSIGLEL